MILVYVTCKDKDEAKKIATTLLGKKLIACANIVESNSLYNWEGKLCDDKEAILLMKTKKIRLDDVECEINKIHSYGTPCILKIDIEANKRYSDWVHQAVE